MIGLDSILQLPTLLTFNDSLVKLLEQVPKWKENLLQGEAGWGNWNRAFAFSLSLWSIQRMKVAYFPWETGLSLNPSMTKLVTFCFFNTFNLNHTEVFQGVCCYPFHCCLWWRHCPSVFGTQRHHVRYCLQTFASGGNESWNDENRAMNLGQHLKILVLEKYLIFIWSFCCLHQQLICQVSKSLGHA